MKTKLLRLSAVAIVAIAILSASFFFSCSDREDSYTQKEINESSFSKSHSEASFDLNPFDDVGYLHNIFVSEIYPTIPYGVKTEDVLDICSNYFFDNGYDTTNMRSIVYSIINNIDNFYFGNINELNIAEGSKDLLKKLFIDFASMVVNQNITDYSVYKEFITNFERDIITDKIFIAENDKAVVLSTTSTLRYSLYYWINNNDYNNSKKAPGWLKALVIVGADALGGAIGTAIGASGPAGAVSSILVGYLMAEEGEATITVDEEAGKVTIGV